VVINSTWKYMDDEYMYKVMTKPDLGKGPGSLKQIAGNVFDLAI